MKFQFLFAILLLGGSVWGESFYSVTGSKVNEVIMTSLSTANEQAPGAALADLQFQDQIQASAHANYLQNRTWLKVNLENLTDQTQTKILYFTSPNVGRLELLDRAGSVLQLAGSAVPVELRTIKSRLPAFQIVIPAKSTETVLIRRESHHSLATDLRLTEMSQFIEIEANQKAILYFYFGGLACLVLFNLLIGLFTWDKSFLYYSFFAGASGSAILCLHGVFDSYLFKGLNVTISQFQMCFSSVALISSLLFAYRFLDLKRILPQVKAWFKVLAMLSCFTLLQGLFWDTSFFMHYSGFLIDILLGLMLLTLISTAVVILRDGEAIAKFFLMSWVILFLGVAGYFAVQYGLLPNHPFFSNGLLFGNLGEMIVISLGLAYKLNVLASEKNQALKSAEEKDHYHRLVKVLSHDVSNAMTLLSGYTLRVQRRLTAEQDQGLVQKMNSTIQKMNDILGMVKNEQAFKSFAQSVQLTPVSLRDCVQEVLHFYEDQLKAKNLSCKMEIQADVSVMADRTALSHQVISNILSNSIKFSNLGGSLSILLERTPHHHRLHFQDNGVGIPPENIQRIFFSSQGLSTEGTLKEKGTGLGTSLIRDYMKLFKGSLEVTSRTSDSEVGPRGTKVTLVFPGLKK